MYDKIYYIEHYETKMVNKLSFDDYLITMPKFEIQRFAPIIKLLFRRLLL